MSTDTIIFNFVKLVIEKYKIDAISINDLAKSYITQVELNLSQTNGLCNHLFKSGKNKGQCCGEPEVEKGSNKCKKHSSKPKASKKESSENVDDKETDESDTENTTFVKKPSKVVSKTPVAAKIAKKKVSDITGLEKTAVNTLVEKRKTEVVICQNKFGNYEHKGTGLVWDEKSKMVTGKQLVNGQIAELTENDVQLCIANGWNYIQNKREVISKPLIEIDDAPSEEESDVDDLYDN